MSPEISEQFTVRNTLVTLYKNGTALISGPDLELPHVNDYLRLEGFVARDARVYCKVIEDKGLTFS